jgi:amino acid adenylation domain-containing protein
MPLLLPELVLGRARVCPAAPAVLSGSEQLTYQQLVSSARKVAGALAARGVGEESAVAVLVSPGPNLVVALLGIWLAGGSYVPLDPLAPAGRLREITDLAEVQVVIADDRRSVRYLGLRPEVALCDVPQLVGVPDPGLPNLGLPDRATKPKQAAYMLFTSGSTGTPKGVVVEHDGIANRVTWGVRALGLSPDDRVLQKTPLTFDAAGWEIFAPLVCGAPVTFGRPDAGRDASELVESIRQQHASVVQVVPSMLRLLAVEPGLESCTSLRMICSAGEPLDAELCQRVLDRVDVEILNTYGPTECAIDVLSARFDLAQKSGPVPIGNPIDNMRYLLRPPEQDTADKALRELYACGPGVGRGYHGDAARTAAQFLPDPLGPPGSRMYRTGDLVRERADGALEFAGRIDAQVKINGVRVEPGEVEAALETHPDVVEAAVRAVTDPRGAARLAAWVVVTREDVVDGLAAYLRDRLPPAMIPATIARLDAIARVASGKKDRSRLPEPEWAAPVAAGCAVEPRNAEERIVLAAWRNLLGIDEIELDHDFFRLGGHSLMMTQLAAKLIGNSGLELDFRELHYSSTVRQQAQLLREAVQARPIDPLPPGARLPLSPAQERFWVLDRMNPGSREYLLPMFMWLPADTSPDVVEQALSYLMTRHEVLRTRYVMDADGLTAVVQPDADVPLRTVETTPDLVGKIVAEELSIGFDLGTAPLLRATLVRDDGEEQLLLVVCHHIIGDGWSTRLLEHEARAAIAAIQAGRDPGLPDETLRYTDAVAWQRSKLTDESLADHLGYWREALKDLPDLAVPTIGERDASRAIDGAAVRIAIPSAVVSQLLAVGRRAGATPHVVFLTLWTVLLAHTANRWDFGVGTPHAGRSRPELHDLVGLFMDVVVIRSRLTPEMSFHEALTRVERTCREAFTHQAAPFEAVVQAVGAPRDLSRTPLYQTLFTLEGDDLVGQRHRERDFDLLVEAWRVARTDLALTMWPCPDGSYSGGIEYATALYDPTAVLDLASRMSRLAERFAAGAEETIGAALAEDDHGDVVRDTVLRFVRDLLKQDDIGNDDDFMRRGGTSLLAARLLWNVQTAFEVDVSMRAFFDRPTAAGLAEEVERLLGAELAVPAENAP